MGRRGCPAEFPRRVLDLVEGGRRVADVAADLGISDQTIYNWRRQDRIDRGVEPGLSTGERAELAAAKKRIRELEAEVAVHRRATELLKSDAPPRRFAAIDSMTADGVPIQLACRVLGVSESGFHAWRRRPPSQRAVRHAWLTDLIVEVHAESRGVYGARRVHAELTLGRGVQVGHGAVELLMRRAGVQGVTGRPRFRKVDNVATASDRVERSFGRSRANELWVTDITEHRTP